MRPHRLLMDPSTLEMFVMLRFNRDLWNERNADLVIARSSCTFNITSVASDILNAGASSLITPNSSNLSTNNNPSVSS